jgi:hypothetical protein
MPVEISFYQDGNVVRSSDIEFFKKFNINILDECGKPLYRSFHEAIEKNFSKPPEQLNQIVIHCSNPRCEYPIIKIVDVDGVEMIQADGLLVKNIDGACVKCGTRFCWSINDKILKNLIEKVLNNRS